MDIDSNVDYSTLEFDFDRNDPNKHIVTMRYTESDELDIVRATSDFVFDSGFCLWNGATHEMHILTMTFAVVGYEPHEYMFLLKRTDNVKVDENDDNEITKTDVTDTTSESE